VRLAAMAVSLLFDEVRSSVSIRGDRRRMTTERCHFDFHEGKKWERHQDLVQFIGALDVEDANVRVLANDPP
jgi:hypothetical protein